MTAKMRRTVKGMTRVRVREGIAEVIKIGETTVLQRVYKERESITDFD